MNTVRNPSPVVRAEAAFWLVGLHGPGRSLQFEQSFKRWLQEDAEHRAAFELLSETWEMSGKLPAGPLPRLSRWQRAGYRQGFIRSAVAVCAVAASAMTLVLYFKDDGMTTGIGEQRTLTLSDGTRVVLNTSTQLEVRYDRQVRRIDLENGEAWFDVAPKPDWPLVVAVKDARITALGTAFVVRSEAQQIAVTLMEGKVRVTPSAGEQPRILLPGERVTFGRDVPLEADKPVLAKVTAWRNGMVDLDDTPLGQAVAEMNRYNERPLMLERAESATLPVTGLFRVGDSLNFANAVAATYGLQVIERSDAIVLSGPPAPPDAPR